MNHELVIYSRFSSDMQSPKSCVNQEREVCAGLTKLGIDPSKAIVISDHAVSGTRTDRDGYGEIVAKIQRDEIGILAVDDQSRLSRGDNVYNLIRDLVYSGGRFISTGEGIDTQQAGWQFRVKVMELHNSTSIQELGRRVQNGQRGRVLEDKSAGDFRFGFESYYLDPNWAQLPARGPKPVKGIRIDPIEAPWVAQIFRWFLLGWSINRIAREMTNRKVAKGHRSSKPIWRACQIRRMLDCEKYIGIWHWGETTTIRNSTGKKRQIPTPAANDKVRRTRPELRIIDDETWEKAQARLRELRKSFGKKKGQQPRGPRVHHSVQYPTSLLGGLINCGECGRRLWQEGRNGRYFLACPNHGDAAGMCTMGSRVPVREAEDAILARLQELFEGSPEWIALALERMRRTIEQHDQASPQMLDAARKRLGEVEERIDRLVTRLEDPAFRNSKALEDRLLAREEEATELRRSIADAEAAILQDFELPSAEWVQSELKTMIPLFRDDSLRCALLLRRLIGTIQAHAVVGQGKKRGFARLSFEVRGAESLIAAMGDRVPARVADALRSSKECESLQPFTLDLGEPTRMEKLAPEIAKMRNEGMTWKQICQVTGLGLGPAHTAWKRYVDAIRKSSPDGDRGAQDERSVG